MFVIAGLGNPGAKYADTRHNIGFIAVDYLSRQLNINVNKIRHKALVGEGYIGAEKVVLVKPQTYMNLSGESIMDVVGFYKLSSENLIVIYDDIDLSPGVLRIRPKGSSGSHNGMKSIIYLLNRDDFPRIRIGIGKQPEYMDLADYVTGSRKGSGCSTRNSFERHCGSNEQIQWIMFYHLYNRWKNINI